MNEIKRVYIEIWDSVTKDYVKKDWSFFSMVLDDVILFLEGRKGEDDEIHLMSFISFILKSEGYVQEPCMYSQVAPVLKKIVNDLYRISLKNNPVNRVRWECIRDALDKTPLMREMPAKDKR